MMGDSHIRIGASMARPPWTVLVVVALFFILPLIQSWPEIRALWLAGGGGGRPPFVEDTVFRFDHPFLYLLLRIAWGWLVAAVFGHGLWRGSRFVHVVAVLWWLLAEIAFGVITISDSGWESVRRRSQIAFYYGAVPTVAGIIGTLLLVLPPSWRWTHHRGLVRH